MLRLRVRKLQKKYVVERRWSMEHRFVTLFGVSLLMALILNQPAPVWGQFQSLGGIIIDDPSCANANDATGQVICAVKGTNSALFGIRFDPPGFSTGFQSLGGIIIGNPSCASDGPGQVTCAVKGTNSALFGIRFNPSTNFSTGFESLGGVIIGNPSCASDGPGQVICAVKGTNSALFDIAVIP